jgi:hypothetical protein
MLQKQQYAAKVTLARQDVKYFFARYTMEIHG